MFLDSHAEAAGTRVALGLINDLVVEPSVPPGEAAAAVLAFDPTSVADRPADHGPQFLALSGRLHAVVVALDEGREDVAAHLLNELLTAAPAVPHLVHEGGRWSLHHHPHGAGLVEAWTSICAESLARLVGEGYGDRLHRCASPTCGRAFLDSTKNGTRRFCSERCQNREKAAALRRRRQLATAQAVDLSLRLRQARPGQADALGGRGRHRLAGCGESSASRDAYRAILLAVTSSDERAAPDKKDLLLDDLSDRLDSLKFFRAHDEAQADTILEEFGAQGVVEHDMLDQLSSRVPLAHPDRFGEAHRTALRAIEVFDRNAARSPSGSVPGRCRWSRVRWSGC